MKALRLAFAACLALLALAAQAQEQPACSVDSDCAQGEFCNTSPACPGEDVSGVCMAIPQLCTMDYNPVAGCDGKKYANACAAASAGQSNTGAAGEE